MTSLAQAKILFVDDEPNVLEGYKRQLRKYFNIETASSGAEALALIGSNGPYAVVVADMRMPVMDGIQFLRQVVALAPDTIRMMLTGNADQQTAIDAINEGHIFRFLTKPCPPEIMVKGLEAGLRQYQLVTAEKELLEKTLMGSIGVMIEVLALTNSAAFGRVKKLREYIREISPAVGYNNVWELEIAALLSPLGHLTIPPDILLKEQAGMPLTDQEKEIIARVPEVSCKLLIKIPRLDSVAQIIRYAAKHYNGAGIPNDAIAGVRIPPGARILKILTDLMDIEAGGAPRSVALRLLHSRSGWYDPQLLEAIITHCIPPLSVTVPITKVSSGRTMKTLPPKLQEAVQKASSEEECSLPVNFEDLVLGDILAVDIRSQDGSLLLSKGNTVTEAILERLNHYARLKGIEEPIYVVVTAESSAGEQPNKALDK